MTQAQTAVKANPVQILKVGHALIDGVRGTNGGAPSKDSIWGVATVQGNVVKFFGRRNGKLRFKTERKADLAQALVMFENKISGKGGKDYSYVELTATKIEELCPGLDAAVKTGFYKAMANGQLNTNATKKAAAKKAASKVAKVAAEQPAA